METSPGLPTKKDEISFLFFFPPKPGEAKEFVPKVEGPAS